MRSFDELMGGSTGNMKPAVVVAIVVIVLLFGAGVYWALQPRYEVLFDNLQKNDLAAISAELDRQGIRYAINESAIMVPDNVVHEARLGIMETGIPVKGAVGYELFDNSDFGMTEFAQRINYQRAVEGELTRTIMALDAVKWARVHIVMPEKQLFSEPGKGPSASVALFVREGKVLTQKQVDGIQRLVASSVSKLESENVTVLDQNGIVLNKEKSSDAELADVGERQSLATEIERHLAKKARDALFVALGTGKGISDVFVTVELDFDKIVKQTESVLPNGNGENIVKKRESNSKASSANKGGGKSTNSTEIEYKLGKEVQEIVKAPGTIKRLSVALVIPPGQTDEEALSLQELVQKVVGFNPERGDQITVNRAVNAIPVSEESVVTDDVSRPDVAMGQPEIPAVTNKVTEILAGWGVDLRVILAVVLLAVLMLILLAYALGKTRTRRVMLSPEQRDALIEDMNSWVSQRRQNV